MPNVVGTTENPSNRTALLNGALSHHGHGIAELAEGLADLQRLSIALANAEGPAERERDEIAAKDIINVAEHTKACRTVCLFEDVGRRGHGMVCALEHLILQMEPRTLGETLSLALVLADDLEVFFGNHVDRTNRAADTERRRLEDAFRAIIRGLLAAGATSPLTGSYATRDDLMPWAEARATAAREAAVYVAGKGEAAP